MSYAIPAQGVFAKIIFTVTGGSAVTLKNNKWSFKSTGSVKSAPNTTDGMLRAPGLFDCSGAINGSVDTSQPIERDITVGSTGVMQVYRNSTKFFLINIIIENLNITTGVDQVEEWDLDWSLQQGTVTLPNFP